MFCYVILMLLSLLYLMFGLVFRTEQARLVLALHHQVLVLQGQLGKRPSLMSSERLALVPSSLLLGKEKLREARLIVKPETLVGWYRAIVRRQWRLLSGRKPGRPPAIAPEMVSLSTGDETPLTALLASPLTAGILPWETVGRCLRAPFLLAGIPLRSGACSEHASGPIAPITDPTPECTQAGRTGAWLS